MRTKKQFIKTPPEIFCFWGDTWLTWCSRYVAAIVHWLDLMLINPNNILNKKNQNLYAQTQDLTARLANREQCMPGAAASEHPQFQRLQAQTLPLTDMTRQLTAMQATCRQSPRCHQPSPSQWCLYSSPVWFINNSITVWSMARQQTHILNSLQQYVNNVALITGTSVREPT